MAMTTQIGRIRGVLGILAAVVSVGCTTASVTDAGQAKKPYKSEQAILWINPLVMLPGDPSVQTSFNAVSSGVGGGLSGLVIVSSTLGDTAASGGNKVVEMGVQVPPHYRIVGVRTCYELSNARSFISQIRLAQVQDPPSTAIVQLDDGTDLVGVGPSCVNSQPTSIDPAAGAVFLSYRLKTGNTADRIVLRAVGLRLVSE
jgi:hypothetical protein